MDNLKHKQLYNDMFFKKLASHAYDMNEGFWRKLDDLCRNHPEVTVTVEHFVIKDRYVSHLLEDIRVVCDQKDIQYKCDQMYQSLYYRVPLIFRKEFEGKDDILKEILGNCQ